MKKVCGSLITIILFSVIVLYNVFLHKNNNLSPAHVENTVFEKVYSEKLSEICKAEIKSLDIPEGVKIPEDVCVYLSDKQAIVDFNTSPDFSKNLSFEQIFIYSLVNTLTHEKDVLTVEFTVNGNKFSSFNGEIDMQETFIPDYNIIP